MVGTIKDETTLLIGARDPSAFAITWEDLPKRLQPFAGTIDPAVFIDGLRKLQPQAKASDVFFTVTTARNFRNGATAQAELKSQQGAAPAFLYELDWETPVEGGKWKSPHALEIGMVFDNVAKSGSMSGTGPEAQKVADQMSAAWLAREDRQSRLAGLRHEAPRDDGVRRHLQGRRRPQQRAAAATVEAPRTNALSIERRLNGAAIAALMPFVSDRPLTQVRVPGRGSLSSLHVGTLPAAHSLEMRNIPLRSNNPSTRWGRTMKHETSIARRRIAGC